MAAKWAYVLGPYTAGVLAKNKVTPGATYSQPGAVANVRETVRNASEVATIFHILALGKANG